MMEPLPKVSDMPDNFIAPKVVLLGACTLLLAACGMGSANLKGDAASLAACDGGPHCVSSQSADPERQVQPLHYSGGREAARKRLLAVLGAQERLTLVTTTPDYIHAQVTTPLMRYVDDLEFLFSANFPLIDVRSSSRIGYYDFNANRNRVEGIREQFQQTLD